MERFQMDLGGRPLVIETGHVAKQAGGAVLVRYGDTVVLVTATMSPQPREGIDFFPLTVDYEERLYAVGRIPGGFVKREGRPSEKAILAARLTDRPIRPLFPEGFRNDVHIVATILSVDQDNPPELAAIIGASTALSISPIPLNGPVGAVAVGYVDGQYVLNPTREQAERNRLNLIVAGTEQAVLMVEAGAQEIPEDTLLGAIAFGHETVKELVRFQRGIVSAVGKRKQEVPLYRVDEGLEAAVRGFATDRLAAAVMNPEKQEREALIDEIRRATMEHLGEAAVDKENDVNAVTQKILREVVRRSILTEGRRPDGRTPTEIRAITCQVGVLPRTHGSALFTRGQTQVLTVATLGAVGDVQFLDGLTDEEFKKFMHHYNFPPYSVGETRPIRGPGRREIGHGALVERAIEPTLPDENEFPYTIRLVSEVLESNGSTSMAGVCGSTLALMDAGIPIKAPVAGIAMGLVGDGDRAVILTDIQGIEDALGDMDFKVAGTTGGVTALQMDIKMEGISAELLARALAQAREARLFVLQEMLEVLPEPRKELSPYAPRMIIMEIDPDKIRDVIGPGGKTINKIIGETDVKIDIEQDGRVYITAVNLDSAERAMKMIQQLTKDVEVGEVYTGRVTRTMNFGAFVEILPGKEGLVHISQLGEARVHRVEDVVKVGDEILVKVTEIDKQGRINLSRREALRQERQPAREPRFNARAGRRRRGR